MARDVVLDMVEASVPEFPLRGLSLYGRSLEIRRGSACTVYAQGRTPQTKKAPENTG